MLRVRRAAWVGRRLFYLSGWSRPTDGAVDTLLAGQGVCRDFAHLVTAVLRALDVPARTVAVYAPGLTPMDFHSVVEAFVEGQWLAVDAAGLAPRSSLVRIATGRDSTDTAFLSSYTGEISMIDGRPRSATVTALEALKVMAIPHQDFEAVVDEDPEVARRLLKTLCARLREAEARASG